MSKTGLFDSSEIEFKTDRRFPPLSLKRVLNRRLHQPQLQILRLFGHPHPHLPDLNPPVARLGVDSSASSAAPYTAASC